MEKKKFKEMEKTNDHFFDSLIQTFNRRILIHDLPNYHRQN